MKVPSIFCREFKRTFNANKYMNYTLRVPESHTHLPFYSKQDLLMGRCVFTLAFVAFALTMYHDPSYFHETVINPFFLFFYSFFLLLFFKLGHLKGVPQYDNIDNVLQGEEKRLN